MLRNDHALNLVRAFADHGERRIAVEALDVVLLRVTVRAVNPHRLDAVLERRLRREVFRHPRFHIAALTTVERRGGVEGKQARGSCTGCHVSQLERDRLVLADRLAERLACLRILRRERERAFRNSNAARGDVDPAELQPPGDLVKTLTFDFPDQMVGGHAVVREDQLRGVDRLIA